MLNINIGDFIEIDTKNPCIPEYTRKYIMKITNLVFDSICFLEEIEGIIVETPLLFCLFIETKIYLKTTSKHFKKIIDLNKIKELELIYKIHLIKKS
jgi:hypothetical protein